MDTMIRQNQIDLDKAEPRDIVKIIRQNEKLRKKTRKTLPVFHVTRKTPSEKGDRMYFTDRANQYGNVTFESNGGAAFQLPRIENPAQFRSHKKSWRHISTNLVTGSIPFIPPITTKHTLNTYQNAHILQDLSQQLYQEEELPKSMLNVDPEFFKIVEGRRIKERRPHNYLTTVRRVLLTRLRIGVTKDEITKLQQEFLSDKRVIEITNDKLTHDHAKYEKFIRNNYKQVMIVENQSRDSLAKCQRAQEQYDLSHKRYYDVRISLFELDERWRHCKLCKNFIYLICNMNLVKDDDEKLRLINKVNILNKINICNTLADIVENFKQDLALLKQEARERKLRNAKTETRDEVVADETGEDKELKENMKEPVNEKEDKDEKLAEDDSVPIEMGETTQKSDDDTPDVKEDIEDKRSDEKGVTDVIDKEDEAKEEEEEIEDEDTEFIKLIVSEDDQSVKEHKDTMATTTTDTPIVEPSTREDDELIGEDFEIESYDLERMEKISKLFDDLDEENMNVLLQKETIKGRIEECKKMKEANEEYFRSKTEHLTQSVNELKDKVGEMRAHIDEIRSDIRNVYESYLNEVCSDKNSLVLNVLIADLFEQCISKHTHDYSTLDMLVQFQDSIQHLIAQISILPGQITGEARQAVARNMRETNRNANYAKRKLYELDNYIQHLDRTLGPKHVQIGKPMRPRSKPPTTPPPKLKQVKSLSQEDMDYLMFFTDYDFKTGDEKLAKQYLSKRKSFLASSSGENLK